MCLHSSGGQLECWNAEMLGPFPSLCDLRVFPGTESPQVFSSIGRLHLTLGSSVFLRCSYSRKKEFAEVRPLRSRPAMA